MKNDIKFNSGYNVCDDKMAILKNEVVPKRLDNLEEIKEVSSLSDDNFIYVDAENNQNKKIKVSTLLNPQRIQSDWNQADERESSFIKNKPGVNNLETSMTALYTIGGIPAGHRFDKGTSVREILDMMFSFNHDGYFLRSIINKNPEELTQEELIEFDKVAENHIPFNDDILSNGYFWTIEPNNQYFYVAIKNAEDTGIKVEKIKQAGFDIELKYERIGSYQVWYFDNPSKGHFILRVIFKNEGGNGE